MSVESVKQYITNENLKASSAIIDDVLSKSKNINYDCLSILRTLSASLNKVKSSDSSECRHIFKIADVCCSTLSKSWKCDHTHFVNTVYLIVKHLIAQEEDSLAQKLILYYKSLNEFSQFNDEQNSVLSRIMQLFEKKICRNFKSNLNSSENSFETLWPFLLQMSEWSHHSYISIIFIYTSKIFSILKTPEEQFKIGSIIFKEIDISLQQLSKEKSLKLLLSQETLSSLCSLIQNYFWMNKMLELDCSALLSILKTLSCSSHVNFKKELTYMINVLSLCNEINVSDLSTPCKKINKFINDELDCDDIYLLIYTSELMYSLSVYLYKNNIIKTHFTETVLNFNKFIRKKAFKLFTTDIVTEEKKNRLSSRIVLVTLFSFLPNLNETSYNSQMCSEICKTLNFYFTQSHNVFATSVNLLAVSVNLICKMISNLIKISQPYQAVTLSFLTLGFLRKFDLNGVDELSTDFINLKESVNDLLDAFVESVNVSPCCQYECLVHLVAIMHEPIPLFHAVDKFKHWCNLKLLSGWKHCEPTVIDLIKGSDWSDDVQDNYVQYKQWPYSFVKELQPDYKLVIEEMKAYLKHIRRIDEASILSVYKIAVGLINSDIVTAARIVCFVCEAFLVLPMDVVKIKTVDTSIKNLIKLISSKKKGAIDEIDRTLLLGDLNYYSARFQIHFLRFSSKNQVVKLKPSTLPSAIPLIENDELNMTIVSSEFSFISYSTQSTVISSLSSAVSSWNKSETLVKAIKDDNEKLQIYKYGAMISMKYIKSVGYIFRLYMDIAAESSVWLLLYSFASLFDVPKYKILGYGEMLSRCLLKDTDSINNMLEYTKSQTSLNKSYYYYLFLIGLGLNKVYHKKYEECKDVIKMIDDNEFSLNSSFSLINVQFNIMSYWCETSQKIQDDTKLHLLIKLYNSCMSEIVKNLSDSFVRSTVSYCLFLDLSFMIGKLFCQSKEVRYARLYTSKTLELAQELHLPIRFCNLLTLHAEIDVMCVSDEAVYKFNGIETILEISSRDKSCIPHEVDCVCLNCRHVEYLAALTYAMVVKIGQYKIDHNTKHCVDLLKDCRELLAKMKKRFYGKYLTDILECDTHFAVVAVILLTDWGKEDKATKYLNHAKNQLDINFKAGGMGWHSKAHLLIKYPKLTLIPNISSSIIKEESEIEDSKTPSNETDIKISHLNYKCFSAIPQTQKKSPVHKKVKKLIFNSNKSPLSDDDNKINEDNVINNESGIKKIDLPSPADKNFAQSDAKDVSSDLSQISKPNDTNVKLTVPDITVITINSSDSEDDKQVDQNSERHLNIPTKTYLKRNNKYQTPEKSKIPVFCDSNLSKRSNSSIITDKFSNLSINDLNEEEEQCTKSPLKKMPHRKRLFALNDTTVSSVGEEDKIEDIQNLIESSLKLSKRIESCAENSDEENLSFPIRKKNIPKLQQKTYLGKNKLYSTSEKLRIPESDNSQNQLISSNKSDTDLCAKDIDEEENKSIKKPLRKLTHRRRLFVLNDTTVSSVGDTDCSENSTNLTETLNDNFKLNPIEPTREESDDDIINATVIESVRPIKLCVSNLSKKITKPNIISPPNSPCPSSSPLKCSQTTTRKYTRRKQTSDTDIINKVGNTTTKVRKKLYCDPVETPTTRLTRSTRKPLSTKLNRI